MDTYVPLWTKSCFSFLEGASQPEELAGISAAFHMPAMALLDRDGLSGAPRFHLASKKLGIRAHIGAEITAVDGTRYPLLAESRTGYQNLCRLITRMKLRARKGKAAASPEDFAEFAEGLICLTGGEEGPLTAQPLVDHAEEPPPALDDPPPVEHPDGRRRPRVPHRRGLGVHPAG